MKYITVGQTYREGVLINGVSWGEIYYSAWGRPKCLDCSECPVSSCTRALQASLDIDGMMGFTVAHASGRTEGTAMQGL